MSVRSIQKIIKQNNKILAEEFFVKSLYLFGSVAAGKYKKNSDIDLLVEFRQDIGLFEFIQLKNYLEKILKSKVDLVTPDALVEWMKDSIEKEKIRVA